MVGAALVAGVHTDTLGSVVYTLWTSWGGRYRPSAPSDGALSIALMALMRLCNRAQPPDKQGASRLVYQEHFHVN